MIWSGRKSHVSNVYDDRSRRRGEHRIGRRCARFRGNEISALAKTACATSTSAIVAAIMLIVTFCTNRIDSWFDCVLRTPIDAG